MIKLVIFDLDNTLVDFKKMKKASIESAVEAMLDAGLKIPKEEMLKKIYQIYWKEGIEDQQVFDKVLLDEFGEIDYKILAAGIIGYRKAKEGNLSLFPRTRWTLTELLKMGIKIAVVSDAPRLSAWLRIVHFGLQDYFETVITYEDTGKTKPAPEPFLAVLEKVKIQPQETIMVGDWVERDIVGAKNLKIKTVFAKYGDEFGVENSGADYVIEKIEDLIEIIRKENVYC